ncbi:MAG: hypothetical protein PF693_05865 [Spirochaetia bacterium]|nr:hypothetical protein [Spirochaetia bacterium]
MRNELFSSNSARADRRLTNLCSSKSVDLPGVKYKFSILPDRQMSFVKILDLPPAPENKLRDMVRFQMLKIYPGDTEDVSFDFISFKTDTGWKIVLYILKKNYLKEVIDNKRFVGIVLPLQLLSKKELQSLSDLIIIYPGMVEIWKFVNGVPKEVERYDPDEFSVQDSLINENKISDPEKLMIIYPYNETPKWEIKNIRTKKFSETLDFTSKDAIYFPEYRVTTRDRITAPIVITAFMLSLVLLSLTTLKHQDFIRKEREVNTWIESIQLEIDQNRGALELTGKLENELKGIREDAPINVYNLLLRTSKAIDSATDVLSFGLKGEELTLTLKSISALNDLEGIKLAFGNVRASNIRTLEGGFESYTVWVEIDPGETNP